MEPKSGEVDRVIAEITAESLAGKPVGSVAMMSECIGYKKMGFWWVVKVHGIIPAIKAKIRDFKAHKETVNAR